MAFIRLNNEFTKINNNPNYLYIIEPNENNFLIWNFKLIGPPDTIFDGGIFNGVIKFPKEYPNRPPEVKFVDGFYHPNVYKDGKVCISILHEGEDQFGYEDSSERWNPSHSVSSIMISIISMLLDPNLESPANIDAGVLWRDNFETYKKNIYKHISLSQK